MSDTSPGDPNPYVSPTERAGVEPVLEAILVRPSPQGLAAWILDDTHRLRTIWRFAIFFVAFMFLQLVAGICAVLGLVAYSTATGHGPSLEQLAVVEDSWQAVLLAVASVPLALLGFGLVACCRWLLDRRTIRSMGFVRPDRRLSASVFTGFVIGVAPIVVGSLVIAAFGGYRIAPSTIDPMTLVLIPCLVLAAFHEEVIFRSYLLQNLLDIRKPVFGVLFTSVAFWLIHSLNPHAWSSPLAGLNLFGAGVLLALAYMVSENIWFPTIMHFAWNFGQGILLSIPVSGIKMNGLVKLESTNQVPIWISGGEFGFEGSAICTILEAALILLFVLLLFQRRKDVK